jgi:hypothetical protein
VNLAVIGILRVIRKAVRDVDVILQLVVEDAISPRIAWDARVGWKLGELREIRGSPSCGLV